MLSRILISGLLFLLIPTLAQAQIRCTAAAKSAVETLICSDEGLKQLDEKLNNAYRAAYKASQNKPKLKNEQLKWLKTIRQQCNNADCLQHVDSNRISVLADRFVQSIPISDKALNNEEAQEACTSLGALADQNRLTELTVPAKELRLLGEKNPETEWNLTEQEQATLKSNIYLFNTEPDVLFKIRLKNLGTPTRFASFYGGGSCVSYQIYNVAKILNPKIHDDGIDLVDDPDEQIRWAY